MGTSFKFTAFPLPFFYLSLNFCCRSQVLRVRPPRLHPALPTRPDLAVDQAAAGVAAARRPSRAAAAGCRGELRPQEDIRARRRDRRGLAGEQSTAYPLRFHCRPASLKAMPFIAVCPSRCLRQCLLLRPVFTASAALPRPRRPDALPRRAAGRRHGRDPAVARVFRWPAAIRGVSNAPLLNAFANPHISPGFKSG